MTFSIFTSRSKGLTTKTSVTDFSILSEGKNHRITSRFRRRELRLGSVLRSLPASDLER
ncbi:hypothetical protein CyaNS01_00235 [Cyanobium sp. NS01]|nr:hypothetical protein CyaNS01_00235 [Cyanobium sp. NS01]